MAREHIRELDVPPPTMGQALFKLNTTEQAQTQTFVVSVATTPVGGGVDVILQGAYTHARIATTAKNVKQGDRAIVVKRGGQWTIVEVETWHEPPTVGPAPPSTTPSAAQTTSWTKPPNFGGAPSEPTGQVLQSLTNYEARMKDVLAHLQDVRGWNNAMASRVNSTMEQVNTLTSRVTGNATAQNATRDLTTGVRDSITGLRDGALQDRMVQE